MPWRDNNYRSSLTRPSSIRGRVSEATIARSNRYAESARGATRAFEGELQAHASPVASWGTVLSSGLGSHVNSSASSLSSSNTSPHNTSRPQTLLVAVVLTTPPATTVAEGLTCTATTTSSPYTTIPASVAIGERRPVAVGAGRTAELSGPEG